MLVLDEPTNDLDLVTLNVLERLLLGFDGSVLLVTHDRWFLDKVATAILAFEGGGRVVRYPGNYETYRALKAQAERAAFGERPEAGAGERAPLPSTAGEGERVRRPGKLSFREQRELEGIEAAIVAAEGRQGALEAVLSDPVTYQREGERICRAPDELQATAAEVARLYARWQQLESLRSDGPG